MAALTGYIFWTQLRQMRIDQRAWVVMSNNNAEFQFLKNSSGELAVSLPLTVTNTGKTPAKRYRIEVVTEINPKDKEVSFDFTRGAGVATSAGTLYPNNPVQFNAELLKGDSHSGAGTRLLSASEYQELLEGQKYLAVYGRGFYVDIFGQAHHFHFCVFKGLSPTPTLSQTKSCSDYNDADDDY